MRKDKIFEALFILAAIIILAGLINWLFMLQRAHSTFQNYYRFRGCTKLLKKTGTYGICQLSSGQTIKMVEFQNKWYLDGDLPVCVFNICF
jgi:hypothetical protein